MFITDEEVLRAFRKNGQPEPIGGRWGTHCTKGHKFDVKNTHFKPNGKRVCKKCRKEYVKVNAEKLLEQKHRYRAKLKAESDATS